MYGTIHRRTGEATPSRRSDALPEVHELRNGSGDRSYSVTAQLAKPFPNGTELSAAYTYTDAKDVMSMDHNIADLITGSTPVDGTLEHRELRASLVGKATQGHPGGHHRSPTRPPVRPHLYRYVRCGVHLRPAGDPNADGFRPGFDTSNDVVYVPRDAEDITLADPERVRRARRAHSGRALPPEPAGPAPGAEQLPRPLGARDRSAAVEAVSARRHARARGHRRPLQRVEFRGQRLGPGPPDLRGHRKPRSADGAGRLRPGQRARQCTIFFKSTGGRSTWRPRAGASSSVPRCPSSGGQLSGLSNASNGG